MAESRLPIRLFCIIALLVGFISSVWACPPSQRKHWHYESFKPGQMWTDNNGNHINAHGGGIYYEDGTYYWFGEHKTAGRGGNTALVGVHVYSSQDLYNWCDRGIALSVIRDDPDHPITQRSVIERPKVVYNEKTGKYVMWFHLELRGQGYDAALAGVAKSDNVTGPYEFVKAFRPNAGTWPMDWTDQQIATAEEMLTLARQGTRLPQTSDLMNYVARDFDGGQMSRDMTIFVDDDQTAYFIYSSEENYTLHIAQLTDDYLDTSGKWIRIFPGGHNEAPAICKHDGRYWLIASGCTGWEPNAARSFVADSIWGPWQALGNPCQGENSEITFGSQSTFILPVQGKENAFIYMGDRWMPHNPIDGRYIWLPLEFEDGRVVLRWHEQWDLSVFDQ